MTATPDIEQFQNMENLDMMVAPYSTHVGKFTATQTTGAQAVTGVGFMPKALIFWGDSSVTGWVTNGEYFGMGFATVSSSGYISSASKPSVATSVGARRYSNTACYGNVQYDGTLLRECTLTSFDPDGFTVNWGTTFASSTIINYLALGGDDITNATVKSWQTQSGQGNQDVTTVGFQPDCVIHINSADSVASPHTTTTGSAHNIGAMDAAGNQWTQLVYAHGGITPTVTGRIQLTDSCILNAPWTTTPTTKGSFVTMLSNGFRVNWSAVAVQLQNLSLCIQGGASRVGKWTKPTAAAPVFDTVTTPGLKPLAVLLTTDSNTASGSGATGERFMVGASDFTNNGVVGATDKHNTSPTIADHFNYNNEALIISNNDAGTNEAVAIVGTATTVSPALPVHQGITSDGTYYYAFDTTAIYKYDTSWNLVASNTSAGSQVGVDHLGDGTYYSGRLYVACCNFPSGCTGWNGARIGVWNASDLSFVRYVDITAQDFDASSCGADPDNDILWVVRYCVSSPIFEYSLSDMVAGTATYLGTMSPIPAIPQMMQGIAYYDEHLYVSYYGGIIGMDMDGMNQWEAAPAYIYNSNETEGLFVDASGFKLLQYMTGGGFVYSYPFLGSFSAYWTTNNAVVTQICYVVFGSIVDMSTPGVTASAEMTANASDISVTIPAVTPTATPPTAYASTIDVTLPSFTAYAQMTANVYDISVLQWNTSFYTVTLPAGEDVNIGPFDTDIYSPKVRLTHSYTTGVTIAVLPSGSPVYNPATSPYRYTIDGSTYFHVINSGAATDYITVQPIYCVGF